MTEETTAPEGEAPEAAAPETPAPVAHAARTVDQPLAARMAAADPSTPETPPETPDVPQEEPFDKERAMATINKLRAIEKAHKESTRRLADYERQERERSEADMSERDRLTAQLKRAEAERDLERQTSRDAINRYQVQALASSLNIVDPEAAVKLLDWSQLEYEDDGTPRDVDTALKQLIHDKPYLVRQTTETPQPRAATGNPATRASGPGQRYYKLSELQDYDFYKANAPDIKAAMTEGRVIP